MLSATAINNAKPKDKPYKLTDEKGLYLLIQATGSKLWRFDYRFLSKRKTLALGSYPDVSLIGSLMCLFCCFKSTLPSASPPRSLPLMQEIDQIPLM